MKAFLEFIDQAIWASFLDDNDWWLKGLNQPLVPHAHERVGVVRR